MGLPMHGKIAMIEPAAEFVRTDGNVILGRRRLARDNTAGEDDLAVLGAGGLGKTEQRILAGS